MVWSAKKSGNADGLNYPQRVCLAFMVGKIGKRITWHYFMRQFILLIAVTAAISVPLVIANLFPIFQLVQARGVPSIYLVKAFVLLFPLVLLLSIPVFVAISLGYSYDKYIRNNEIAVLSSAGFSKLNIAVPGGKSVV